MSFTTTDIRGPGPRTSSDLPQEVVLAVLIKILELLQSVKPYAGTCRVVAGELDCTPGPSDPWPALLVCRMAFGGFTTQLLSAAVRHPSAIEIGATHVTSTSQMDSGLTDFGAQEVSGGHAAVDSFTRDHVPACEMTTSHRVCNGRRTNGKITLWAEAGTR